MYFLLHNHGNEEWVRKIKIKRYRSIFCQNQNDTKKKNGTYRYEVTKKKRPKLLLLMLKVMVIWLHNNPKHPKCCSSNNDKKKTFYGLNVLGMNKWIMNVWPFMIIIIIIIQFIIECYLVPSFKKKNKKNKTIWMVLNDDFMSVEHEWCVVLVKLKQKKTVTVPSPIFIVSYNRRKPRQLNESRIPSYRAPKVLVFLSLSVCVNECWWNETSRP